jgi:hypothetical protein
MGSIIFVNISSRAMAITTLRQMPYTEIDDFDADLPCKGQFALKITVLRSADTSISGEQIVKLSNKSNITFCFLLFSLVT